MEYLMEDTLLKHRNPGRPKETESTYNEVQPTKDRAQYLEPKSTKNLGSWSLGVP